MGNQEQRKSLGEQDEAAGSAGAPSTAERIDTAEIDDLLDEIDEVLEENAEEFVRGFVQKGGQ